MKKTKCLLLTAALISSINCSTATNTTTAGNVNVAVQNASTAANAEGTPSAESQTAKIAPDAVVKDLYKQHDAKKSPFFQTKDRALVDKYFEKKLADMIWKDAKESNGEVGALGADPLYDAQDTDIKKFAVGQPKINGDQAEVVVTFDNFNEKVKMTYLLAKQKDEWKISDIKYDKGYSLVSLFNENSKETAGTKSSSGEFEGKYQIGDTTCTVKPVKMAFEVRWEKGSGVEMFFSEGSANDRYIFASNPDTGKANSFAFDDENYNTGTFYRADGKEFPIKRIK